MALRWSLVGAVLDLPPSLSTSDPYLSPAVDLAAAEADKLGKMPAEIKVAMAMENDPFAQDVRAGVLDDIERHGMQTVIDDQLPPELNDMSPTLNKVKACSSSQAARRGRSRQSTRSRR